MPITGLTLLTAEVPLVMYTLVIFVRNLVAGFDSVPADVRGGCRDGLLGTSQRLWRVELPLAVPLIVAGLRIAAVSTIGIVTISGILGDGSAASGSSSSRATTGVSDGDLCRGACRSILLAIAVDLLLVRVQRRITPWAAHRRPWRRGP